MRVLRLLGNVVLWLLAAVGVLSALLWGATKLGYVQPLVVISGSMEPGIMTGDLLVDVRTPTQDVRVGEVAAIYNPVTQNLVSHRVVSIEKSEQTGDSAWDDPDEGRRQQLSQDGGVYDVGDHVWTPVLQVAGGGRVIATLHEPVGRDPPRRSRSSRSIGLSTLSRPEDSEGRRRARAGARGCRGPMTRRLGAAGSASMILAFVLTVAAALLGASAAGAAPTSVPLTFEFTGLYPGREPEPVAHVPPRP